ncbi:MAG: type II secretion system protein GspC [Candidatus Binatia bacterium]
MKISPRHLVGVNLALLALIAYWGASTVSTAVAAKLSLPPQVRLSQPPPPIAREPRRPASYYATIHTRDIFNSAKPEPEKPPEPPKPTELKLKLWGVAVRTDGGSHCIIEDLTTHKQDVYGIKDKVPGNATVKSVEWDRVILDRAGQDEILELAQGQGAPPRPVPAVAAAAPSAQTGNPHIRKVSDTQYSIDRSEVDSALDNMSQLFTQIRAVPHFEGGQSTGFRLFAIRQNSLFDSIGLRNGDIIQSINGTEINDPQRALGLINELRNASDLTVSILRNKEPVNLQLKIGG